MRASTLRVLKPALYLIFYRQFSYDQINFIDYVRFVYIIGVYIDYRLLKYWLLIKKLTELINFVTLKLCPISTGTGTIFYT
jgi:hypothetical protein